MHETGWLDITSSAAVDLIHERMTRKAVVTPTGFRDIDRNILLWGDARGIPQGSLVIIGGASNAGKTQFGLWLLRQAAETGQRAGMISLDMKNRDAIARFHMGLVGQKIPYHGWRPSTWQEGYRQTMNDELRKWRMAREAGDIAIHMDRNRSLAAVMEKLHEGVEAGATFFVLDHMQKVRVDSLRGDPFATADLITETLDDFVDEHDVTVVGLSQLNRNASRETDRSPTMYDLWGGTSMEANSAIVIMLDHSRYARLDAAPHISRSWVLLEKNQMGPKRLEVAIEIDHATLSFREADRRELDSWPTRGGRRAVR